MKQVWNDLLFAHWPVTVDAIRNKIPPELQIDTYDGQAWIGVVPFDISGLRMRALPPVLGMSSFPEINLRTYVKARGKAGVFFFSLDAANPVAVRTARATYKLPYFDAKIKKRASNGEIIYSSTRSKGDAAFEARYRPTGPVAPPQPGTLDHWLTMRYSLYSFDSLHRIYRAEIHHEPWPLQAAEAEFLKNTLVAAHGIKLPDMKPLLHFSKKIEVLVWPLKKVS